MSWPTAMRDAPNCWTKAWPIAYAPSSSISEP